MSTPPILFDPLALRRQRARAAAAHADHAFLHRAAAEALAERLGEVRRDFRSWLELGCHRGLVGQVLAAAGLPRPAARCDVAWAMVRAAGSGPEPAVVAEPDALPFPDGRFDLVVSVLALQWTNDLPGALIQAGRVLAPDGLLLAAFPGGESLHELRRALTEAELEIEGGAGPRVSPFVDIRDAGGLLQRAGFALPVADRERLTVTYDSALALMRDLRGMGEANAMAERRRGFTRRRTMLRAVEIYHDLFALPDGRVPATFELLFLTAWAPDASQPKALAPGSGKTSLAEALRTREHDAGDIADPRRRPKPPRSG